MLSADNIKILAREISPALTALRHDFHRYPELGFAEHRTCRRITAILKKIGINKVLSPVAGTGVIGLLKGRKGRGKTIALRADMDALPIQEENNLPYKSCHAGVMHACGHDAHITMCLGAAMILKRLQKGIRGNVKFIFQPAEERLNGAPAMIRAGALESPKVNAIFALHVYPALPLGVIGCRAGPLWAAADRFIIEIKGRGGHGAFPFKCLDPVPAANQIYNGLQSIERNLHGTDARVISVCSIHGGKAFNIIPDMVTMEGTVRTFDKKVRSLISQRMREIAAGIGRIYGINVKVTYEKGVPATINHEKIYQLFRSSARDLGIKMVNALPQMGGEDFSYYLKKIPGAIATIGIRDRKTIPELHNSRFDSGDRVLPIGAALLARSALAGLEVTMPAGRESSRGRRRGWWRTQCR
jgi:amidohydrolase